MAQTESFKYFKYLIEFEDVCIIYILNANMTLHILDGV